MRENAERPRALKLRLRPRSGKVTQGRSERTAHGRRGYDRTYLMKRDTRANLIFLIIFVALALPGIIKLTRHSYVTGGRDPAMRPAVRGAFAYMDPTPPVGMPRVVPPSVAEFIQRTAERLEKMQPGLHSIIRPNDQRPVMSSALNLQLLGRGANTGHYNVALFGWNSHYAPLPELYDITATRGGEQVKGQMTSYEPGVLTLEVRSELQDFGYVVPPDSVLWMIITFPGEAPVDSVTVKYHLDKTSLNDWMPLAAPATGPTTTAAVGQ